MHHETMACVLLLVLLSASRAAAQGVAPPPPGLTTTHKVSPANPQSNRILKSQNGMRIIGPTPKGQIFSGRLEVASKAAWLEGSLDGTRAVWRAVCNDGSIDEGTAKRFCANMGFAFGHKYFDWATNYVRGPRFHNTWPSAVPIGSVRCARKQGAGAGAGSGAAAVAAIGEGTQRRSGRLLLQQPTPEQQRAAAGNYTGMLALPTTLAYACSFTAGACGDLGPATGISCSDTAFDQQPMQPPFPASPPPPLPPSPPVAISPPPPPPSPPPAAPIDRSGDIMVMSLSNETNWCAGTDNATGTWQQCAATGRVELLLRLPPTLNGSAPFAWVPLCAADISLWPGLLQLICNQEYYYPWSAMVPQLGVPSYTLVADPGIGPVAVPSVPPFPPGSFDPTTRPFWAWLQPMGSVQGVLWVQQLKPVVTRTPCTRLLSVACRKM